MFSEDELLLIEIQKYSHLYDTKDKRHKNKYERARAWNRIGKSLGENGLESKQRFVKMRDRFRKENAGKKVVFINQFGLWRKPHFKLLVGNIPVESTSFSPFHERCVNNTTQGMEENTLTSIRSQIESLDATLPQIQSVFSCCLPSPQNEEDKFNLLMQHFLKFRVYSHAVFHLLRMKQIQSLDATLPQIQSVFSCCLPSPQNEVSKRKTILTWLQKKEKNCQDMDQTGHFLEYIGSQIESLDATLPQIQSVFSCCLPSPQNEVSNRKDDTDMAPEKIKIAMTWTKTDEFLGNVGSQIESLDATLPQIQSVFSSCLPSPQNEVSKRKDNTDMAPEKKKKEKLPSHGPNWPFLEYIESEIESVDATLPQIQSVFSCCLPSPQNEAPSLSPFDERCVNNTTRGMKEHTLTSIKSEIESVDATLPQIQSVFSSCLPSPQNEAPSLSPFDERCVNNKTQGMKEHTLTSIKSEIESLEATLPQIQSVFSCCLPSPQNEVSNRKDDTDMAPEKI
ncbi:hypothetical protein CEXT_202931 [Caerostris extrusa]|uniref:MADF domain-containing protein n=1 Tax=Caerostris extrusa TaxID=172846 RepID=A0AAV4VCQ7_CAEEX|nr:hypothetical protein CEXT_202931 [Caerostris extrusa]